MPRLKLTRWRPAAWPSPARLPAKNTRRPTASGWRAPRPIRSAIRAAP